MFWLKMTALFKIKYEEIIFENQYQELTVPIDTKGTLIEIRGLKFSRRTIYFHTS
jgi:hypothetical protein